MTEDKSTVFENTPFKIGISIAQISVLIIVLSVIKEILFYKKFDFPIQYFLNLSGIGMVISEDLIIIFPIIIVYGIMVYAGFNLGKKNRIRAIEKDKKEGAENPKNQIKLDNHLITTAFFIKVFIVLTIGFILLWLITKSNTYQGKIMALANLCLSIPVLPFLLLGSRYTRYYLAFLKLALIGVLLFGLLNKLVYDIDRIENGKYNGTKIYTSDSTYTSTDTTFFIGKTENYYFMYNSKKKYTRIIPSASVTMIDMQSK